MVVDGKAEDKVLALLKFEFADLPVLVLEQVVPYELLFERFPRLAEKYVNLKADTGFGEKDFSLAKYSFVHGEGTRPYYVVSFSFPFDEGDRLYVGLARRMHMVFSQNLQGIHLFLEVLQEELGTDGVKPCYEVLYLAREEDGIVPYSVCRDRSYDGEALADSCAFWAWRLENGGGFGDS